MNLIFFFLLSFASFSLPLSVLQKAIRVTTFMQRLKNSEALTDSSAEAQGSEEAGDGEGGVSQGTSEEGDKGDGGVTSSSVSLEVTVENTPAAMDQEEGRSNLGEKQEEIKMTVGPSVGTSPSDIQDPLCHSNTATKLTQEESDMVGAKKAAGDGTRKMAANFGQNKFVPESKPTPAPMHDPTKLSDGSSGTNLDKKPTSASPDPSSKRKMAATLHGPPPTASADATASSEKKQAPQKQKKDEMDRSWCQTQVPEAVAERSVAASLTPAIGPGAEVDIGLGVRLRGDGSPVISGDRDSRKTDRYSAEFSIARAGPATGRGCYAVGSSASLGRHATPYNPEVGTVGMGMAGSFGSPYSSLYTSGAGIGFYGTGLQHGGGGSSTTSDWQMDSVIEQIEKQMAAVLEKIEGDMPSLLEQISDCPAEQPRARSTHASPATSRAQHASPATSATPPPLPTSPRPTLPSLPHLTIPPPSYPPPSPPTQASPQAAGEQEDRDGRKSAACSSQSPRSEMGRGL